MNNDNIFSKKLKAGKRRTYFFDVRTTKSNDYFVTLTESKRRFNGEGYDRHKIFLYKEDFNKFLLALTETIDHVKTELMPDFDFDSFNHDDEDSDYNQNSFSPSDAENNQGATPASTLNDETNQSALPIADDSNIETSQVSNPTSNDEAETW